MAASVGVSSARAAKKRSNWFAKLIKRLESEYRGTQAQFAKEFGLSDSQVRNWKNGIVDPIDLPVRRWDAIARVEGKGRTAMDLIQEGNLIQDSDVSPEENEESLESQALRAVRQIAYNAKLLDSLIRKDNVINLLISEVTRQLADLNEFRRSLGVAIALRSDSEDLIRLMGFTESRWTAILGSPNPVERPSESELESIDANLNLEDEDGNVYTLRELKRLCGYVNGDQKSPAGRRG